jgi:GntR family transcriptional regulator
MLGVKTGRNARALRAGATEIRRGRGITVAGTPERGAVIAQAKELVQLARRHGYRVDELVRIIEQVR